MNLLKEVSIILGEPVDSTSLDQVVKQQDAAGKITARTHKDLIILILKYLISKQTEEES